MNLDIAEICVTTQHRIDCNKRAIWLKLEEFGDITELYAHLLKIFADETDPIIRFEAWDNIPDIFISKEKLEPSVFEVKTALERLDEQQQNCFEAWCRYHGYNLAADNPDMLVTHFLDTCGSSSTSLMPNNDEADSEELFNTYFDNRMPPSTFDIFDDNYD